MRKVTTLFCSIVLLVSCGDQKEAPAGTEKAVVKAASTTVEEAKPDSATMMKNWMEYMQPGQEHQMMESWNGTWTAHITMWMSPDAPPAKSAGTTINKTLLGGRYQQATHKGSWDGMPFEGLSTLAFDNAKKVFISTWIDNMGTGMMTGEGPWDEATRSITIKGKMMDPMLKKEVAYREVFKVIDENTQEMEMYATAPGGGEFKTMVIKYTRSK